MYACRVYIYTPIILYTIICVPRMLPETVLQPKGDMQRHGKYRSIAIYSLALIAALYSMNLD